MREYVWTLETHKRRQNLFTLVVDKFWHQLRWKKACWSPYLVHQTKIWAHQRLDRWSLLRNTIKLGLRYKEVRFFYAKIYQDSPTKVQALHADKTTTFPLCTCAKTVWRKSPSPPPHWHPSQIVPQGDQRHPARHPKCTILCTCCWYHPLLEEEVPTSSTSWSGTLTSLLNTPLRSRLQLP